jgi:hypothetical protein
VIFKNVITFVGEGFPAFELFFANRRSTTGYSDFVEADRPKNHLFYRILPNRIPQFVIVTTVIAICLDFIQGPIQSLW